MLVGELLAGVPGRFVWSRPLGDRYRGTNVGQLEKEILGSLFDDSKFPLEAIEAPMERKSRLQKRFLLKMFRSAEKDFSSTHSENFNVR